MKRKFLVLALLMLFVGIGVVVWTAAGLPPVRMVWRYGFSYQPEPTGKKAKYEGIEFVEIGPGCFRMGSDEGAEGGDLLGRWCARLGLPWGVQPWLSREMPVHWVEFPHGFWIARTEVTNAQYEGFNPMHERREYSPGDNDPVVGVSWEDAKQFCAWLSEQSGRQIRLPSESEWECACRAGSNGKFYFGDEDKLLCEYAWYRGNSDGIAHAVGTRRANAWGLHDCYGNAWEWCEDSWHEDYRGAPTDGTAWEEADPMYRVLRGGCSSKWADRCRSAYRGKIEPDRSGGFLGIRLAFSPSDH